MNSHQRQACPAVHGEIRCFEQHSVSYHGVSLRSTCQGNSHIACVSQAINNRHQLSVINAFIGPYVNTGVVVEEVAVFKADARDPSGRKIRKIIPDGAMVRKRGSVMSGRGTALDGGRSTGVWTVAKGAATIKTIKRTRTTSINGVTLML